MCLGGGGDGGAGKARKEEKKRQQQIRIGTNSVNDVFGQFNEGFFQRNVGNPFLDYSMPQFNEQRRAALGDLVKGLAGRGLLSSSVGARARNEFSSYADRQRLALEDQARAKVDEGLNSIEGTRNNIITQLNATGDANAAIRAAQNQAQLLGRAPTFSPLGQLFQNFSSLALNRRAASAGAPASGGSGVTLYGSTPGSAGSGVSVGG